ncbi:Tox-REase-5 domain-containing protein [uncultured Herbaspirillum sp.]|uniref:Tox-REase-5 domain-containing protein n=1 Tax=uncultured Herbaspirillum sp. TaxID=160236 RepID=UPI002614CB8A|nr:Tox-REase-5 domain-containing protein [uncultured Herbaspirillum sp.]
MVALPAIPLVGEVLTWLGLGAAGVGTAAILERNKRAEQAQNSELSKAEVTTLSKEKCRDCPPMNGFLSHPNYSMSDVSREYQARVTGYAPGTEWNYENRDFDGFQPEKCLLQEAKAQYTNFFDEKTLRPKVWYVLSGKYEQLMEQARAQHRIVSVSFPAALNWYFMGKTMYLSMKSAFTDDGLIRIEPPRILRRL